MPNPFKYGDLTNEHVQSLSAHEVGRMCDAYSKAATTVAIAMRDLQAELHTQHMDQVLHKAWEYLDGRRVGLEALRIRKKTVGR